MHLFPKKGTKKVLDNSSDGGKGLDPQVDWCGITLVFPDLDKNHWQFPDYFRFSLIFFCKNRTFSRFSRFSMNPECTCFMIDLHIEKETLIRQSNSIEFWKYRTKKEKLIRASGLIIWNLRSVCKTMFSTFQGIIVHLTVYASSVPYSILLSGLGLPQFSLLFCDFDWHFI